jgi:hypothetical protein
MPLRNAEQLTKPCNAGCGRNIPIKTRTPMPSDKLKQQAAFADAQMKMMMHLFDVIDRSIEKADNQQPPQRREAEVLFNVIKAVSDKGPNDAS